MDRPEQRLDPDEIVNQPQKSPGRLKIYFGYAAGAGKTYAMLDDARQQHKAGVDVLVGYLAPHTRPETMQLMHGLPVLAPQTVVNKGITFKEFDLDAALVRKPALILIDELAHANAPGQRNQKRYQDIEELLNAGIDVYTTLNVQHMESLNDVVRDITKADVKETVPDSIFDQADQIQLIDIGPDELLRRMEEGKGLHPDRAEAALRAFFTKENLRLLRELALRRAADRVSHDNQSERRLSEKMANAKLLVCIGPSPSSARCIRWTARASESFHAPWTAVYVEKMESDALTKEQQKAIRANMDLAEKLGAEVVTLSGHSIAGAVTEYARLSGITNIVIGKSKNKKTLRGFFSQDLEDELVAKLPHIEVHIISTGTPSPVYQKQKSKPRPRFLLSLPDSLKTLGLIGAATLLSLMLQDLGIGDQNIVMVYILAVSVAARMTAGYAYGVAASLISVLIFSFLFTEPYLTFSTIRSDGPITFFIMLLVAVMMSAMTVRIKSQARLAVAREHRTYVLYEINKKLLATRGLENIIALTNGYVVNLFNRSVIFYAADPMEGAEGVFAQAPNSPDDAYMKLQEERAAARWVFVNRKRAGSGTDTLSDAGGFYMPVISQKKVLAVIGISCRREALDHNTRLFLRMIASQVAMALERQQLSDEQRTIMIESEKEKMRGNLLRAISHDLRTPLSGIWGASSAILENEKGIDAPTQKKLLHNIRDDSQWLIRMVENLLSVTRIQEGSMRVAKSPEAAEEVVAEAVSRIRKRYPNRGVAVKVPRELLMIPMDDTLIAQVLMNLTENAVKHSPDDSTVEVNLIKREREGLFEVIDHGTGIPPGDLPHIFEGYLAGDRKDSGSMRGMGIGLSICQSIIKAHGGVMEAENRPLGGAVFRFTLPLDQAAPEGSQMQ